MMRRLPSVALLLAVGCGRGEASQVRIEPYLPPGSTSCPADTRSYSIRCVNALVVALVGKDGQRFKSQCTPITTAYDSLQALVSSTTVVEVLKDVKARSDASLELRAYYKVAGRQPCESYDGKDDYLLFWGMSPVTDFTDSSVTAVKVQIDCRPQCDCEDLEKELCPAEMPPGICAPPENRLCRKQCETADNCYGSTLSCEIATCGVGVPGNFKCCAPAAEQVCSPCAYDGECESGICVHNTTVGVDEWFCAEPCPPLPDVTLCPPGMSCKLLNNGVYERAPAGP
jgi:hypothetical protein